MENALFLLHALHNHFHDINQDLVEEVLACLSTETPLVGTIKTMLLEKPTLILFKLAVSMGITFEDEQEAGRLFALVLESDNPPNFMCYVLQLITINLSVEQWNKILNMSNLLVCSYAAEYAQRNHSLEYKERLLQELDYTNPTALLFIDKLSSQRKSLSSNTVKEDTKQFRNKEELLEAIHRAVSFNQSFSGCSCSKHYECHDY